MPKKIIKRQGNFVVLGGPIPVNSNTQKMALQVREKHLKKKDEVKTLVFKTLPVESNRKQSTDDFRTLNLQGSTASTRLLTNPITTKRTLLAWGGPSGKLENESDEM